MIRRTIIKESVRGIIEYVLKEGSIDDRYLGRTRAIEGTLAHQKLQKLNENIYENYNKEVQLEEEFIIDDIGLIVEGRADGIIIDGDKVYIEEIKSTYRDLINIDEDYNELHWAQGKFYAYIYALKNKLNEIYVRLSYFQIETEEVKSFDKKFQIKELEEFIYNILSEYKKMIILSLELKEERDESIKELKFPFEKYRKGQKKLAVTCYNTIKERRILFAQAPTGIGKTISTLFPAVKSLGEGKGSRIMYLTAKTITRTVAEDTVETLKEKGLVCRNITLTAKEKICFKEKVKCNPDYCEYALNYYDKINEVIYFLLKKENNFSRTNIEKYAKEYKVCPFELSLDLSLWCDLIICDYNYAFDPKARLKRFFEEDINSNILLVDEGHNLINRAREMFSTELYKSKILSGSKIVKGRARKLYKSLKDINSFFIELRRELQEKEINSLYKKEEYKELYKLLSRFLKECDEYLIIAQNTEGYEEIKDLYFDIRSFISISELYDDNYVTLIEQERSDIKIKLFCINPSKNLGEIVRKSYSSIIFSATLTPLSYYINLLGGDIDSYRLRLPSPFSKENLRVYKNPLNMRYKYRDKNIDKLCEIIKNFTNEEIGNYMIFFPSYEYLKKVYLRYVELYGEERTIVQGEALTEAEKEGFLSNFYEGANISAFCVIGGMFSEGIDLPGKKLIGSIVIGVGFPKISNETNIIMDYFKDEGFDYAYVYPGINKVMQAIGRVIRREEDKGRVLLIDDRYFNRKYIDLLPSDWQGME
ncbi:ATP-dependent DNA helicase [Clostridium isatidis]|uniref:ATP-dependent DNA helicase n=1 Tax=Clostridium isatidis TaxID=182773 RepID=UPI001F45817F|nr:ATP-dependent DNA helicase [Clostridium isatidis]